MTKKIQQIQERSVSLANARREEAQRSVRAALSTETPVDRMFGREVLIHSDDAIDLSRADNNGLPLLVNHDDRSPPIGRVRNLALEDGVLRGDLVFSDATQPARDAWALASEGTLSDVSIRYRINAYEIHGADTDAEEFRVTDWTILEGSVVSVPADANAGIGRQMELEGIPMPEQTNEAPAAVPTDKRPVKASASRRAGVQDGVAQERERVETIQDIGDNFEGNPSVDDAVRDAIRDGTSVEDFKESLIYALAERGAEVRPLAKPTPQPELGRRTQAADPMGASSMSMGETDTEKRSKAISEALEIRCNRVTNRELIGANPYTSHSLLDFARMSLESRGISCSGSFHTLAFNSRSSHGPCWFSRGSASGRFQRLAGKSQT